MADAHNLRSEAEILARQSRPQRNSTWTPKKRDWRYATGVFQHDDFDDAPNSRSVWDTLDYDYQADGYIEALRRSGSVSITLTELGAVESSETFHTPKSTVSPMSIGSWKDAARSKTACKPMTLRRRAWAQVKRFGLSESALSDHAEARYDVVGLVVRLHFMGKNTTKLREILEQPIQPLKPASIAHQNMMPPIPSPDTPATARTADTIRTPLILDSIKSLYTFPLFKRTWVDETYDFRVDIVREKLRPAGVKVEELGEHYGWYTDAVPIDAIFPPGVPLSAKEITAFYPHHVRWKGVMVRLTNNDYRGADIMGMQAHFRGAPNHLTTTAHMNNYQRDVVKTAIPGFKTSSHRGNSDRNLRTDHLAPGPYVESMRKGYTLPTFEDLLRGLRHLPSGLDARGLTQCLSWYLKIRDTFTPELELNVIHTQSLIRALRQPLKPFGPQNLDRNALEAWRNKETFETFDIEDKKREFTGIVAGSNKQRRTQLHLNLDENDVSMNITLPIRHVLTFPFLALHGVVSTALKMGIEKAEIREASRKVEVTKRALEARWAAEKEDNEKPNVEDMQVDDTTTEPATQESKETNHIPKRPRPVDTDRLSVHKKQAISTGPRSVNVSRRLAPTPPRPQDTTYLNRSWNSSAPSSAYAPQHQQQPRPSDPYARRDYQARQPDPRSDAPRQHSRSSLSGGAFGHGGQHPSPIHDYD